jgi:YVTN family beta-propeller protein
MTETTTARTLSASFEEITTVDIGDGPHAHIAYSGPTNTIWALNGRSNSISVLDGTSAELQKTVRLGGTPRHIVIDDKAGRAYVALAEDKLVVVSLATVEIEKSVILAAGSRPNVLVPQPELDKMYVLNDGNDTVVTVSVSDLQIVSTVSVGSKPAWGQPHKNAFGRVHVTNSGSDTISVIDDVSGKVVATVHVGRNPNRNAVYRERNAMYTANLGDNTLTGVSVVDDSVVGTAKLDIDPFRLVPAEKKTGRPEIWVLGRGSANLAGGIRVVDAVTHTVSHALETVENPANWLFEGPLGQVVSQTSREMAIIDTRSVSVVGEAKLSHDPDLDCLSNMVFNKDHLLFLANADNTVTLFKPRS